MCVCVYVCFFWKAAWEQSSVQLFEFGNDLGQFNGAPPDIA